jgi:hypothetical protein
MLELYIFSKKSPQNPSLTYWSDPLASSLGLTELSFSGDRFKLKKDINIDFFKELNSALKENPGLRTFFEGLSASTVELELIKNYHHVFIYDSAQDRLILDETLKTEFIPLYIFAFYYALARRSSFSEDSILGSLFSFLESFSEEILNRLIKCLEGNQSRTGIYDAGSHLYFYLLALLKLKQNKDLGIAREASSELILTQLFRNRSLAGQLPVDIIGFEEISEKHREDAFSGSAVQEYYEAFKSSYSPEYAKEYFKHLCESLKAVGFGVVAQRGSRVAHEQGPILINSGTIRVNEDFSVQIKKIKSSLSFSLRQFAGHISDFFPEPKSFDAALLDANVCLDELLHLINFEELAKARLERNTIKLQEALRKYFAELLSAAQDLLKNSYSSQESLKDKFMIFYDHLKNCEKTVFGTCLELEELTLKTPSHKKQAVIFVQRPSSRSGHFIPRMLLGQNLYVETDAESEVQRINAIPYNFVAPDLDCVASGIDAFFENASISIVTDRKSGEPDIKWENAEDLAVSLAPGIYQAIKSKQAKQERFHYQLETTLFGPLIELFMALLENEISNVASLDNEEAQTEVRKLTDSYRSEVMEAARFVFKYYLLEDYLLEHMLREALSEEEAAYEVILSLRDVQQDLASYCLLKRHNARAHAEFLDYASNLIGSTQSPKLIAEKISKNLNDQTDSKAVKIFIKKYLRYPESSARKELLAKNKNLKRLTVTSNKSRRADLYFDFTVAPSRIDFGKHVVASVTTMMGRMLGADDADSMLKGKEYIDLVSKAQNSFFETASEAGSVKVIENTCRAIQYSKAISFQGVFSSFYIDGSLARAAINSRDNKAAGLHVMEYGTMAATGYCITKEPLFILLALAMNSDDLLSKLGIDNLSVRDQIKNFMSKLLAAKDDFASSLDWELYAYEEISSSQLIQGLFTNPDYEWLPNINSLVVLFNYLSESRTEDAVMQQEYSRLASVLIKYSRVLNETGIIQRIHLMNDAIRRSNIINQSDKKYEDLVIALNASYKGNVSDERENANQYLIAMLLQQKQYLKNVSDPDIAKLIDFQINNYGIPKEIRIFDPYVDPDVFMGGELKARAEAAEQRLILLAETLHNFTLSPEIIKANVITYGSDPFDWRLLNKKISSLPSEEYSLRKKQLKDMCSDVKYLEIYHKGFYKNPLLGFQGVDIIQLNSNHDQMISFMEDLPLVKAVMQTNNPSSLLILVDNPQQAKRPFLDYDKGLEWLALGGTLASHMIAADKYELWRKTISQESKWAKNFINFVISPDSGDTKQKLDTGFSEMQRYADLKRDFVVQEFNKAKEMDASFKSLNRYREWIQCLSRIINCKSIKELGFKDWLILGGRWVLNGQEQPNIDYVLKVFDNSEQLMNLSKEDMEILNLFVTAARPLPLEQRSRIVHKAGSTKEADLLVSSAGDSLEFRAKRAKHSKIIALRAQAYKSEAALDSNDINEVQHLWDKLSADFEQKYFAGASDEELSLISAKLLRLLEKEARLFIDAVIISSREHKASMDIVQRFINQREASVDSMLEIFGDHRSDGGLFQRLAAAIQNSGSSGFDLAKLAKLGEAFNHAFLLLLLLSFEDANDVINKLTVFFDQYLNVHEEDYPPYMFHRLCAGDSYGFNHEYFTSPILREKMFQLSCQTGTKIYKLLHHAISKHSVLKNSCQEYKDALIGDYENGIIPICYQHETVCIEERFWDCMRALRNFVRNYHDRHPLPIIIKGADAKVSKLFRYELDPHVYLIWIAGLASPGKHSWDLNCVLRSPQLRDKLIEDPESGTKYINISVFAPFLTRDGEIKQIYTAFDPKLIEEQSINYIAPDKTYELNSYGYVHAVVLLEPDIPYTSSQKELLPKPDITMSAHTHPQYINGFTNAIGAPEVWSYLSMKQMYSKTEIPKILHSIGMQSLTQIEFLEKEFNTEEQIAEALSKRIQEKSCEHISWWILKASKDSGGRGVSNQLNINSDFKAMVDFIYLKSRTDDVVMQEFVPNNARAFISSEFTDKMIASFVDSGVPVENKTPYEKIYFAMRSFQSLSGIKGYLFSVNIGAATVNAGQGAKMFYGEPIYIMPPYIAGKIQKLLDEQGELILKEAIPKHAAEFAKENAIEIVDKGQGLSNCFMLNGLFDYIPYVYVERPDKNSQIKQYKVICDDNVYGGLDYYYDYHGEQVTIASGKTQVESLMALETLLKDSFLSSSEERIDLELAKVEFNSGLGQANLLQKAIEETCPHNRDLFLEWTKDLGVIGKSYQNTKKVLG